MIVCLCEGVNDNTLRRAIRQGCDSVGELSRRTGAGRHCGACACDLKELLRHERPEVPFESSEADLPLAAK